MSNRYKTEDILRLMKDTKQIAELTLETIKNHLVHCENVKKEVSKIALNIRKGTTLDIRRINGAAFADILEVTALAPENLIDQLEFYREKIEDKLVDETRDTNSIASDIRKFLNVFYKAYGKHYRVVFGEQVKSLIAIQGLLSKSSVELAKSGARDVQDANIEKIESGLKNAEDNPFILEDPDSDRE